MWHSRDGKCPAEVYRDRESACRVMLGMFETQEDCARFHGCPERRCAVEGRWPEDGECARSTILHSMAAGFVGVAFHGPAYPEDVHSENS